jgi:hypothetical protein
MAPTKRPADRHSPRPRLQVGDLVMANGRAPGDYRGRRGLITEISDVSECRVEFDDGLQPTTGVPESGMSSTPRDKRLGL